MSQNSGELLVLLKGNVSSYGVLKGTFDYM